MADVQALFESIPTDEPVPDFDEEEYLASDARKDPLEALKNFEAYFMFLFTQYKNEKYAERRIEQEKVKAFITTLQARIAELLRHGVSKGADAEPEVVIEEREVDAALAAKRIAFAKKFRHMHERDGTIKAKYNSAMMSDDEVRREIRLELKFNLRRTAHERPVGNVVFHLEYFKTTKNDAVEVTAFKMNNCFFKGSILKRRTEKDLIQQIGHKTLDLLKRQLEGKNNTCIRRGET